MGKNHPANTAERPGKDQGLTNREITCYYHASTVQESRTAILLRYVSKYMDRSRKRLKWRK
jgi:uncharacterized protein YgiM (DUF1202 family)